MNENFDNNVNNETNPPVTEPIKQQPQMPDPDYERTGLISMLLGIGAVVVAIVFFGALGLDLVLAIISLIFARKNKKVSPDGRASTSALVGTICAWIAIVIFSIWCVLTLIALLLWIVWIAFAVIVALISVLPAMFAQSMAILPVALLLL